MNKVLTIAGSDCSGGAGIQADIKTITAHRMYAMSAITALTAQNTTGVYGVQETPADFLAQQLDCIFTDIVPDAVKIGMVSSAENISVISDRLRHYGAQNIVLDTVMFSTSGRALLKPEAMDALRTQLLPLAQLITPNIPETEALCGSRIETREQMEQAGFAIAAQTGGAVLALLENIFKDYGADSYVGKCAAVIIGSSETIFYVCAVYFSKVKVKSLRFAIPISLVASFFGAVIGCLFVRIL